MLLYREGNSQQIGKAACGRKEIFADDTADKALISKMQREHTRFNIKQQIIGFKNVQRT